MGWFPRPTANLIYKDSCRFLSRYGERKGFCTFYIGRVRGRGTAGLRGSGRLVICCDGNFRGDGPSDGDDCCCADTGAREAAAGRLPNFYISFVYDAAPLSVKQKFSLATRGTF